MIGTIWVSPSDVFRGLLGKGDSAFLVWQLRLPRAAEAVLVGAMLGAVGSAFQALFRNPLADPYVVGVSSGAAVGGAIAQLFALGILMPMVFATFGGLGALLLVMLLAARHGKIETNTLLLAGVVTGSLLSAVLSLVLLMAGQDTNQVLRWLLGSITPAFWSKTAMLVPFCLVGVVWLTRYGRDLNALSQGEMTAQRLGVDVRKARWRVLVLGSAMVGASVGAVGIIGFLGLVAPHLARRLVGVDWRVSLPASALLGAAILVLADLLAQRLMAGAEIPVGIVTALIGAPFLLGLLRRTTATG
jgi:iron complex transport system permease protein